ncbi:MAG: hypothetical protein UY73_C0039G0001 [Parcubacteria group bacterium GW2011_GWA2_52_8]|nr:MAG: hypothetical protein UY73_C0039G0001 [Parcubacteria group bacterium GW2011_GWA2_52_8]
MESLDLPLKIIPADIDERSITDPDPNKRAEKIARAKAEKIAEKHEGIIIAADTYTVCQDKVLEKPHDKNEARLMLKLLSGKSAINYNGFCYIDMQNNINFSTTARVVANFRELSDKEIDEYVSFFPVTSWAAAYSPAYPYGMTLIQSLNGSLTGFTHGLPMELVVTYLQKSGMVIKPKMQKNV